MPAATRPINTRPALPRKPVTPQVDRERPSTAPGSQERMILALREAAQKLNETAGAADRSASGPISGSPASGIALANTVTASRAPASAPPIPLALASSPSPSTAGGASPRTPGRVYPLPPIGERGDILGRRPVASSGTTPAAAPIYRPRPGPGIVTASSGPEPVPAVGRNLYVPKTDPNARAAAP